MVRKLTGTIVVEERIETSAVDIYAVGIKDTETPRHGTVTRSTSTGRGKVWIVEYRDDCPWRWCNWGWLIISGRDLY